MTETIPLKRLERERNARLEAERLLEEKSRELYRINEELKSLTEGLEKQVGTRTLQLQQARDQALKESNAKSRFIAVMSHEVRNSQQYQQYLVAGVSGHLTLSYCFADSHAPKLYHRAIELTAGV